MTDARCEVRLLGQLSVVFFDGRETITRFRTRKAALLLALLALRPGQTVARETIVEYLWPDLETTAARDNLSTTLSQLRRQLGGAVFQADHATIRLAPELVSTDIQRFEKLVRQRTQAALTEALALWGNPLPGVYDAWAIEEQNRLQALADEAHNLLKSLPTLASDSTPAAGSTDAPMAFLPPLRGGTVVRKNLVETLAAELLQHRLWTLLGPGGVGKTHLSLTLARELASQFTRTVFVSLAEVPTSAFLLPSLGRALRLPPPPLEGSDPLAEIIETLNSFGPTLLILDNLEHLLLLQEPEKERGGGVEGLVECLWDRCPALTIITTSRQALGLHSERVWPVPPLTQQESLQLFVLRARDVRPDFTLHTDNQASLEKLCGQLEGLPLAVELAAGWARLLSPERLIEKVEAEAHKLAGRRRDAPERQQSLAGALAWSWRLLTAPQQASLRRLSILPGEFSLELAEALLAHPEALKRLAELEERSLLTPTGRGWRLLEPLRAFLAECLEEAGETAAAYSALTDTLLARIGDTNGRNLDATWLDAREEELSAIRAALLWCIVHDSRRGQELAKRTWQVWEMRGYMTEGRRFVRQLDTGDDAPASFLHWAALIQLRSGNYDEAECLAERGCVAARLEGNRKAELWSLRHLQTCSRHRGDLKRAQALTPPILALAKQLDDPHNNFHVHNACGLLAMTAEDYAAAKTLFMESIAMARQLGTQDGEIAALNNLGLVSVHQGELGLARESYTRALTILAELGYPRLERAARAGLGAVVLAEGDCDLAERYLREALALSGSIGMGISIAEDLYGLVKVRIACKKWEEATRVLSIVYRILEERRVTPPKMVEEALAALREHFPLPRLELLWQAARLQSDSEVIASFPLIS